MTCLDVLVRNVLMTQPVMYLMTQPKEVYKELSTGFRMKLKFHLQINQSKILSTCKIQ